MVCDGDRLIPVYAGCVKTRLDYSTLVIINNTLNTLRYQYVPYQKKYTFWKGISVTAFNNLFSTPFLMDELVICGYPHQWSTFQTENIVIVNTTWPQNNLFQLCLMYQVAFTCQHGEVCYLILNMLDSWKQTAFHFKLPEVPKLHLFNVIPIQKDTNRSFNTVY